jgi:hypothetical protein
MVDCAGSSKAVSQQAFTAGQTSVPYEPAFFHRTVVTSVAGSSNYVNMQQHVEGVRSFAGQTATLSFWAKADATRNIAIEFAQIFGSGGSASGAVLGVGVTTCTLTTAWQKFTVSVAIPSISGKVIGTNNDDHLDVLFWLDAGSNFNSRTNSLGQQSGTFDIAQVQFERGSVATPFERRTYGQEMALCQRYYCAGEIGFIGSAYAANAYVGGFYALPVTMRAAPTLAFGTPNENANAGSVATTVWANDFRTIRIWCSPPAAGQVVYDAPFTASAEL